MLNKPRGFVTTMSDEKGRPTVAALTEGVHARVYPIGRLDMDSDGLLLLTNDGKLAEMLTHPRHSIPKIYHVTVTKNVDDATLSALRAPMTVDGYKLQPVKVNVISRAERSCVLEMTLFEGRNRQIRKMCEQVGLKISRLSRIALGSIRLGTLKEGRWRRLTRSELEYLYSSAEEKAMKGN
jgi:23S rRNA pseudouridine2605 synthase